jgi:hypothetical protein
MTRRTETAKPARRRLISAPAVLAAALAAGLLGCAPALDWRELRPAGSQVQLLFPCKPSEQVRRVTLAGTPVRLSLWACSADGQTWALAHADLTDPARVGAALAELRASALANLGAESAVTEPLQVSGATPNPGSQRMRLAGKLPDGTEVQEQVAVFTRGTVVYQATALGPALSDAAAETFITSLRTGP